MYITGSKTNNAGSYECEGDIYASRDSAWRYRMLPTGTYGYGVSIGDMGFCNQGFNVVP